MNAPNRPLRGAATGLIAGVMAVGASGQESPPVPVPAPAPEESAEAKSERYAKEIAALSIEELEQRGWSVVCLLQGRHDLTDAERVRLLALGLKDEIDHPAEPAPGFNGGRVDSEWHRYNWIVGCDQIADLVVPFEDAHRRGALPIPDGYAWAALAAMDRSGRFADPTLRGFDDALWSGDAALITGFLRVAAHAAHQAKRRGTTWAPLELRSMLRRACLLRREAGEGCMPTGHPHSYISGTMQGLGFAVGLPVACEPDGRPTVDFERDVPLSELWTVEHHVGADGSRTLDSVAWRRALASCATEARGRELAALAEIDELLPADRALWNALDARWRGDAAALIVQLPGADRGSLLWIAEEVALAREARLLPAAEALCEAARVRFPDDAPLALATLTAFERCGGTITSGERVLLEDAGFLVQTPPPDGYGPPLLHR